MLSSITPFGERGRGNTWGVTVGWFVVGAALGGAAIGTLLGAVGQALAGVLPLRARLAAMVALAVTALVVDLSRRPGLLPSWRRQVDERWIDQYRPWVYGAGFGAQLGAGVLTIVSSASTYLVLALAVLSGSVAAGAALAATFGLVRGLSLLTARPLVSPAALRSFHQRLPARRRLAEVAVAAGEVTVAISAAVSLAG